MSTPTSSFQPPRKEKSKTRSHNSTDSRAGGTGKNVRKTKSTSIAHRRYEFDDRPLNFEAVRRVEARRAAQKNSRGPAPKRGDVKGAIFKDVVDATRGCLCASPTCTRDADALLDSLPFPTKSQPMTNLWPSMDAPLLQE